MKTKIIALAGMLALSLLTSLGSAQVTDDPIRIKYADSFEGTVTSGVIKSLADCPTDTAAFFKNVNPFLSGGNPVYPVERAESFLIDGKEVVLNVTWYEDNSFKFDFDPDKAGIMHELGLENNSDKLIYKYPSPVGSDGNLNVLQAGGTSEKANHIDICISPVDIKPPFIEFISPLNGEQVSGTVIVEVRVTDESGVDPGSVTASVYQGEELIADLGTGELNQSGNYEWVWPTTPTDEYPTVEELPAGSYEIRVSATDLAEPDANTGTAIVTVELVRLFTQCFGTIGPEDFDNPAGEDALRDTGLAGGCNPTGGILIQAPPNGTFCNVDPGDPIPDICYIAGTFLQPDSATVAARFGEVDSTGASTCPAASPGHCPTGMFPDCRMAPEVDGALSGPWFPKEKVAVRVFDPLDPNGVGLDASQYDRVLAEARAAYPDDVYGADFPLNLDEALVWDEDTYCANGCCLAAQHTKGALLGAPDPLDGLYQSWDTENGTAFAKVHTTRDQVDERAPGKGEELVPFCYKDTGPFFLENSFNVGYQPLFQTNDDTGFMTVLTENCNSPARTLTRGNGFDVGNLIVGTAGSEYIGLIDEQTPPEVALEAVEFRLLEIQEDFDRVFFLFGLIDRDGLLLTGNFNRDVQNPVKEAQRKFQSSNIDSKDQAIAALREAVDGIRTKTTYRITEANPPGEALALMLHIIYELGVTRDEELRIEQLPVTP